LLSIDVTDNRESTYFAAQYEGIQSSPQAESSLRFAADSHHWPGTEGHFF
jgi:hypothetical protein